MGPWSPLDPEVNLLLSWYREWSGYKVLPYGSQNLLDEPAFVFEAIDIVNTEINSMKSEQQRKAQIEHEKAMKKARRRNG